MRAHALGNTHDRRTVKRGVEEGRVGALPAEGYVDHLVANIGRW